MNTVYVLILVYSFGYGPRTNIYTQEFTSAENCESARVIVGAGFKAARDENHIQRLVCTKK